MRKLRVEELNRLDAGGYENVKKNNLVVLLDNIRSLNNIGSVFRTADAFLVDKILLCGITGCPPHRDIHKTALGAENIVKWEHHSNILAIVRQLKSEGYKIIAVEQMEGSIMLNDFSYDKDSFYAFIFGNEVEGISDEIVGEIDACIEIPQFGTKHSLNISVTAGIMLWDYFDKTNLRK
ncbi:MAG: RNA methyltransferase [Bacteroidetes bacterium GWE2_29_8]|nr:MAG: RNA methyltransferase [Bacteroidetes bacterium GWE2_29_8]OFY22323.1 MAG: RNA methyltransferase [Bacteroidetes bacterium GWF2_29_10]